MLRFFSKKKYEDISAKEVEAVMNDGDKMIVDVREIDEYQSGHIPQAKWIPLGQLHIRLEELNQNKEIIVVCASGGRSARAAAFLVQRGYTVKNMVGGMGAWRGRIEK